jgi:hypothetical protein
MGTFSQPNKNKNATNNDIIFFILVIILKILVHAILIPISVNRLESLLNLERL